MCERTWINQRPSQLWDIYESNDHYREWRTSGLHIIATIGEHFFSDPGDHGVLKPALTKLQTFPQVSLLKYTCIFTKQKFWK